MHAAVIRGDPRPFPVSVVVPLLVFAALDGFVEGSVLTLMPAIRDLLGTGTGPAMWISATQFLSAAVCVPVCGRLGDLYGHRRMLRVALGITTAGCLLCALAPGLALFLAGRALLGILSSMVPLGVGLARDRLTVNDSRRAVGMLMAALLLGSTAGDVSAGFLTEALGDVRAVLWILTALAAVCLALCLAPGVAETRYRAGGRMDWRGTALLTLGLTLLLGATFQGTANGWTSPGVLAGLLLAPVVLILWLWLARRTHEPLADVRAMARRATAPAFACGFTLGVMVLGGQGVLVAYLDASPERTGYGFGLTQGEIGLWLAVPSLGGFLVVSASAAVARRVGYRTMLTYAFLLAAVGFAVKAAGHRTMPAWGTGHVLSGLGTALAVGGIPTVIAEGSPRGRAAVSTAVYDTLKTTGGSFAGAAAAALLSALLSPNTHQPTLTAYLILWGLSTVLALVSAAVIRLTPDN